MRSRGRPGGTALREAGSVAHNAAEASGGGALCGRLAIRLQPGADVTQHLEGRGTAEERDTLRRALGQIRLSSARGHISGNFFPQNPPYFPGKFLEICTYFLS